MNCSKEVRLAWLLISCLLVLRVLPTLFVGQAGGLFEISLLFYFIGTYLVTGLFLFVQRRKLADYFISSGTLLIYFCSPLFLVWTDNYNPAAYINLLLSLAFLLVFIRYRQEFSLKKRSKHGLSLLVWLLVIVFGLGMTILIRPFQGMDVEEKLTGFWLLKQFLYQLGTAAIMEEPLFRGFLCGQLKKAGWKSWAIIGTQALVFWILHFYYANTGLNFWILLPSVSILLGALVLKTKNLAYSLTAHAILNTLAQVFVFFVQIF